VAFDFLRLCNVIFITNQLFNFFRRVREVERYTWAATRGVNEELLFENMPDDLQRDIRRHLFKFLKKVISNSLMTALVSIHFVYSDSTVLQKASSESKC